MEQILYAPTYIKIGDKRIYEIETPKRDSIPDDYGEPDIWIEFEEITNDHEYFYIRGKSNLLEGTLLRGGYYSSGDSKMSDSFYSNETHVQPDGTFEFRAFYESLSEDGFIRITSKPNSVHETESLIYKAYGEKFEQLEGEYVIYKEDDEQKEIEIILFPPTPEIEAPEDTDITEDDGEFKVQVPDDVLFDFDKSDLKPDAKNTLDEIIAMLESLEEGAKIQINGHTDSQGEPDYNLTLSEKRAHAVEEYMMNNGDIGHLDITTKGYGETKPIASNEEKEGRERNRRVEIVINANENVE